jgi:tetratricopeptide (TPR) repeat protein
MKKLEHPDTLYLQAAQGWLELGNHIEADRELDEITPELRAHPNVLLLRCEIYSHAKQWESVVTIADTLVNIAPRILGGWIHRSFALHELKRTQEAYDKLLPAAELYPKEYLVRYNLACYTAQLGQIKKAEDWLKAAMALNESEVKEIALDDPDLEPLWKGMEGSSWKRSD